MKAFLINLAVLTLAVSQLSAVEPLSVRVANVSEDLELLNKDMGQLRLEIESLNRENDALKYQLADVSAAQGRFEEQHRRDATLIKKLSTSLESYKKTMVTQVADQMNQLSKETQKAMNELAKTFAARPQKTKAQFNFTDDYPKEGIAYTVKSGDTLSVVALKNHSTTRDIQNANRIEDPRALKAGQVIFIPQKSN